MSDSVESFDPRTTGGRDVKKILMPARLGGTYREHAILFQTSLETCCAGLGNETRKRWWCLSIPEML